MDWDKYSEAVVYSGGVDHAIKAWDLRRPQVPLSIMHGHGCAACLVVQRVLALSPPGPYGNPKLTKSNPVHPSILSLKPISYAVRRLKASPFREGALGSVSYDMSCRTWNTKVSEIERNRGDLPQYIRRLSLSFVN